VLILRVHHPERPHLGVQLASMAGLTLALLCLSIIFSWHFATSIVFAIIAAVPIIWLMYEIWYKRHTSMPKSFACPLVPVVPLLGMACNIYLILNLSGYTLLRWFVWFVVGTLFYFVYGIRHSKIGMSPRDSDPGLLESEMSLTTTTARQEEEDVREDE